MIRPRQHLLSLERDVQNFDTREGVLRLDMNEYVPNASLQLHDALMDKLSPEVISAYPMVNEAYHSISKMLSQPENKIVLTTGCDGAIYSTLMAFCNPGDTIAFIQPTYGMYSVYAKMMDLYVLPITYSLKKPLDYERILNQLTEKIKVLIIANPNGIIGDELNEEFISMIVKKCNVFGTVVLLDEVYADFVDGGYSRFANLTDKYDNLVVARSFSKGYGLAGVRAGYTISHPDMRRMLISVRSNVEINSVAVEAIKVWASHPELMKECIYEINDTKQYLCKILVDKGITCIQGLGNFILISADDEDKWKTLLSDNNIAVKWLELDGEKWIRLTVGTKSYMQDFVELLEHM